MMVQIAEILRTFVGNNCRSWLFHNNNIVTNIAIYVHVLHDIRTTVFLLSQSQSSCLFPELRRYMLFSTTCNKYRRSAKVKKKELVGTIRRGLQEEYLLQNVPFCILETIWGLRHRGTRERQIRASRRFLPKLQLIQDFMSDFSWKCNSNLPLFEKMT